MKQKLFSLILIIILLFGIEGLSALSLKYLKAKKNICYQPAMVEPLREHHIQRINKILKKEEKYVTHSPQLGWTIKPNGQALGYSANSQGIRADRDYSERSAKNKIRIATFGDSFTHCDEVNNNETWQEALNQINPKVETLNFGVGGYGLDQAYLRYIHDGRKFHPDIVIIGFMSENIVRNMNIFRPFYNMGTHLPLSKPRFVLSGNNLKLINNPLDSLDDYQNLLDNEQNVIFEMAKNDYFIQNRYQKHPWDFLQSVKLFVVLRSIYLKPTEQIFKGTSFDTTTPIYKTTEAILKKFYLTVVEDGAIPVVAIIPNGGDIGRMYSSQVKTYEPFLDFMKKNNFNYVDLTDYFYNSQIPDDQREKLQAPNKHFNALGNQKIAEYLNQYIQKEDLINKAGQN